MNGAVYISFFQGQLESVLEQVVQLAVQEISKTVGSSLNTLLMETAAKEQENRRLRLQLQARDGRGTAAANGANTTTDGGGGGAGGGDGPLAAGKTKSGDDRAASGRIKTEQRHIHAPEPGLTADTRRLEQRGRAVDQLKAVMEQVLDFAVCELSKIVEASFDDLLLEISKMEREQQGLEEHLGKTSIQGGGGGKGRGGGGGQKGRGGGGGGGKGRGGGAGRRMGSENDSESPSGSEDNREEPSDITESKGPVETDDKLPVLSVSQDWVPILDKVFGQKWCSDVWQIKELDGGGGGGSGGKGLGEAEAGSVSAPSLRLEPTPSSPQQDPRWTPLEDMEVLSPDQDNGDDHKHAGGGVRADGSSPGPALSPTSGLSAPNSSASMLHRLLTLPSQLLEDDETTAKEALAALAADGDGVQRDELEIHKLCSLPPMTEEEEEEGEEEEEEGEEEDKGRKKKRRRVWSECDECGRRFSRVSLLKAHRQMHAADPDAMTSPSSPPPPDVASPSSLPLSGSRCSECGKRFSSSTRLHSHIRTQHPGKRS